MDIFSKGFDEFPDRFQAALKGGGDPTLEEPLGGPWGFVLPELFKFILQYPGPMDPPITPLEGIEDAGVLFGTVRRVPEEEPAKALESLTLILRGLTPLLFADLIDGLIESFGDMEAVQDQFGVRAMLLDGSDIGLAHVTAGPCNLPFLVVTELFGEEPVDGFAALSRADPDNPRPVKVIDHGGVLMPSRVGNLVNADGFKCSNSMAIPDTGDGAVKQIGKG